MVRMNPVVVITGTRSVECPHKGLIECSTEYYSVQ